MKLSVCLHFVGFQSETFIFIFSKILLKFIMLSSLLQTLIKVLCVLQDHLSEK